MKVRWKIISILSLLILSNSAFSGPEKEGGHTGNGGGTIFCGSKQVLVLDYYEIPKPRTDVLDLETISREAFIKIISSRLIFSAMPLDSSGVESWSSGPYTALLIEKLLRKNGPLDSWPTTDPWRIRDEAIGNDLPKGCEFKQAAISRKNVPYRISDVTRHLSEGQKRVLELHEALFAFSDHFGNFVYNGTSVSVRRFVRTLIRKTPSARELQVAWKEFESPRRKFSWENDELLDITPSRTETRLYRNTGLYSLDLRSVSKSEKSNFSQCPLWVGLVPSADRDSYLYVFGKEGDPSSIREFFLPEQTRTSKQGSFVVDYLPNRYTRKVERNGKIESQIEISWPFSLQIDDGSTCPYTKTLAGSFDFTGQNLPASATLALDDGTKKPEVLAVKRLIEYYEATQNGLHSQYENAVRTARDYFESTVP